MTEGGRRLVLSIPVLALLDGYWERVAKRGKDESPYRAAFAQIICVADTDA